MRVISVFVECMVYMFVCECVMCVHPSVFVEGRSRRSGYRQSFLEAVMSELPVYSIPVRLSSPHSTERSSPCLCHYQTSRLFLRLHFIYPTESPSQSTAPASPRYLDRKPGNYSRVSFSHTLYSTYLQLLLVLPSKYSQNLSISHNLYSTINQKLYIFCLDY